MTTVSTLQSTECSIAYPNNRESLHKEKKNHILWPPCIVTCIVAGDPGPTQDEASNVTITQESTTIKLCWVRYGDKSCSQCIERVRAKLHNTSCEYVRGRNVRGKEVCTIAGPGTLRLNDHAISLQTSSDNIGIYLQAYTSNQGISKQ